MGIVIALGGNAILRRGERGTAEEQFGHVQAAVDQITALIERGEKILITHGNGPQVGDILLKNEIASNSLPRMPLDICGAESQGMIGYMIQQSIENALRSRGIVRPVMTCITQTLVDPKDPAFLTPSKPIGPFYTEADAQSLRRENSWEILSVGSGEKRFRRVVPSPEPLEIVEHPSIRSLFYEGFIVIAAGGGGIPVCRDENGSLKGVEAVIDKDLTAGCLASLIQAEVLLILTDVPFAYRDFATPGQQELTTLTVSEAQQLLSEGHFGAGSMEPKIRSCIRFVLAGGRHAVITSLEHATGAFEGREGTVIVP